MKLRRLFFLIGAFLLVLVKFAIDVIGKNVILELGGLHALRELITAGAFVLLYLVIEALFPPRDVHPVRRLGLLLILAVGVVIATIVLTQLPSDGFDTKEGSLIPLDYPALFFSSLMALLHGIFALTLLRSLWDLVLLTRKQGTRRNYLLLIGGILLTALCAAFYAPLERSTLIGVLTAVTTVFAVVVSFRLPWIVYLSKRDKTINLVYTFFLFVGLVVLTVFVSQHSFASRGLAYYSRPLAEGVFLSLMFGSIYAGMAFVSTLFHLPTAEAFDRKRSELSSLHTLGKLITQVSDFSELVDTVTSMTRDSCEASSAWIEVMPSAVATISGALSVATGEQTPPTVAGLKNITAEEIALLHASGGAALRDQVCREHKPMVVENLARDPRLRHDDEAKGLSGSLVLVPLVSHSGLLGILCAMKDTGFGFMQDDVDLISTFADQATIAIENARLFKTSIERERLMREMYLAQEMQRKLLPQYLPRHPAIDIDAISTPAFEVGGDYYDFVKLPGGRVGVIVGDVSGKGVSAAFYMSEVKGIFQSLSPISASPCDFMKKANTALASSIDKHSFVSLLYAILDVETGVLVLSRAGHCPMLHVTADRATYIRPDGMGLGLGDDDVFGDAIREQEIRLQPGDVCVLYTDGITEAHLNGEEFGYERLSAAAWAVRHQPASVIKREILDMVDVFIDHQANHDDLTLVVVKWLGVGHHASHGTAQPGGVDS
jgi:phosphoserine phosphatase RsbU/P